MIEDNIWYRYKSYSDNKQNHYNGLLKMNDTCIHFMVHYGKLVQLHIMSYRNNFSNGLYKDDDIKITNMADKLIIPIIAKNLLNNEMNNNYIFSVRNGIISKKWG